MKNALSGIIPAIASPCDEHGRFREDDFSRLISRLYKSKIDGLYVCGGTGDGFKMTVADRKRATQIAVQESKRFAGKVITQVGAESVVDTIELAEHAANVGADAVSSLPAAQMNKDQLMSYYRLIAEAAQLPVLAYYMPAKIGQIPLDTMENILDIEGVIGFKITDWNLFYIQRILLRRPETMVFNGMDECLFPALFQKISGGIGMWYNIFPLLFVKIHQEMRSGTISKALELHNAFLTFADFAWTHGLIETFELLMKEKNIATNCFRRPKPTMTREKRKMLLPELQRKVNDLEIAIEK